MRRLLVDCRELMPAVSVRGTDSICCRGRLFGLRETRVQMRLWDRVALAFSPRATRVHGLKTQNARPAEPVEFIQVCQE
jgi:hypothetical protein